MSKIDAPKLQVRPLAPRISQKHSRADLCVAAAAAATASLLLFALVFSRSSPAARFSIVIDAGSTGTRIHVFGFTAGRSALDLGSTAVMKATPGLSAFAGDPESAGRSLVELLEFGRGRVPSDQWGATEVRLMATAGMRMVEAGARERILESCRRVLRASGFRFRDDWATVISGSDEGIYAWVAANYALGTLGGDPQETTGIIELGGASAQVTFVSGEPTPSEFSHEVKFGEATYNVYSNSFLHFGQNVAYESLHQLLNSGHLKLSAESAQKGMFVDPCTPKGYSPGVKSLELSSAVPSSKLQDDPIVHATGNFSECRFASQKLLNIEKDKCSYEECRLGSTFIPKMQGRFLATENLFYTTKFFGLGSSPTLSDLILAGQQFCGEDWLKLEKKYYTLDKEILSRYCFSSAYIVALLHDNLGISLDDKRITFANQVGNVQLEWALGAFITQRSLEQKDWFTTLIPDGAPRLLALVFISAVFVFSVWLVSRWRKPQVKTIYDLEKGRYIVTRVSR